MRCPPATSLASSKIHFFVEYHTGWNEFVSSWRCGFFMFQVKGNPYICHFFHNGIMPQGVVIVCVKFKGFGYIDGNPKTEFESSTDCSSLG